MTVNRELVEVTAPFEMPVIQIPDFAEATVYSIVDYGAREDDQAKTDRAIMAAIEAASESGGGRVLFPLGTWKCGPIHLRSNVELHLESGAELRFSGNPADYLPAVPSTWEGMECYNYSPLVYAYECENVAITGKGKLVADLERWREWYARPSAHMDGLARLYEMMSKGVPVEERQMTEGEANLRPQFIQFNRCRHVLVEGIEIEQSPFWVIHPYLCQAVVIRNVSIRAHGHNNDGVDPEMSQNVLIEGCCFDQGDDAIAIKSGRNHDAWRLATPTRNVVVRNCQVRNGHQLVAIGSELSGGVENVLVEDCVIDRSIDSVGHLLFIKTNERRGGFVRNVFMRRIQAGGLRKGILRIDTNVLFQWRNLVPTYERRLTAIESIHLNDIEVGDVEYVCWINGEVEQPVRQVNLRKVLVGGVRGPETCVRNVENFNY